MRGPDKAEGRIRVGCQERAIGNAPASWLPPERPLEEPEQQRRRPACAGLPVTAARGLLEAAELQQRLDAGILAAELAVGAGQVARVADGEDLLAEDLAVLAGQAAVLLEPLEGIVVQHLGAEVGVVAGRIAAVPDMGEV